jgi:hypothetical protein
MKSRGSGFDSAKARSPNFGFLAKLLIVVQNAGLTAAILVLHALVGLLVASIFYGGEQFILLLNHGVNPELFNHYITVSDIVHGGDLAIFLAVIVKGVRDIFQ